jgi:flagellar basal body-associated protein FliL
MAFFELGKGKKAFFRIWLIVLIVLFVIAASMAICRRGA